MKTSYSESSNRYRKMFRQAGAAAAIMSITLFSAAAAAEDQDRTQTQAAQVDRSASSQKASEGQTSIRVPSFWTRYDDHQDFDRH
jgi:hypothetical protein